MSQSDNEVGLYNKYLVERIDRSEKHRDCEYFVLDITHDPHARAALHAYAVSCSQDHPKLAEDLYEISYSIAKAKYDKRAVEVKIEPNEDK